MTDDKNLREKADKTLSHFGARLADHPSAMPQLLSAAFFSLSHAKQIVIASTGDSPARQSMLHEIHIDFLPNKIILSADSAAGQRFLAQRIAFIKDVTPIDNKPTAYVCENYLCKLPTNDLAELRKLLHPVK
jgi:uncharacterized protein